MGVISEAITDPDGARNRLSFFFRPKRAGKGNVKRNAFDVQFVVVVVVVKRSLELKIGSSYCFEKSFL